MSLISLIVPVYNTEKYLKRCLDSLINQSFKDIEIIIVNDGSTDGSKKIIEEYLEKDNRSLISIFGEINLMHYNHFVVHIILDINLHFLLL